MEELINLTKEELKSIREIQKEYTENVYKLGQLQIDYVEMSKRIEEEKHRIFKRLEELKISENTVIDSLTRKYGDGTLNIKEGTYKPVKKS